MSNRAALRIGSLRLFLLQSGRLLWERPLDDGKLRLRRLATGLGRELGRHGSRREAIGAERVL